MVITANKERKLGKGAGGVGWENHQGQFTGKATSV
jgi:hypothetical protein